MAEVGPTSPAAFTTTARLPCLCVSGRLVGWLHIHARVALIYVCSLFGPLTNLSRRE